MKQVEIGGKWYSITNNITHIAMDDNGKWFAYEGEPNLVERLNKWLGYSYFYICTHKTKFDWRTELYEV